MEEYLNHASGIAAYEIGPDFIRIKYKDNSIYRYTNKSTGVENIKQMKCLAMNGKGLNTFINQHVRLRYAEKEA